MRKILCESNISNNSILFKKVQHRGIEDLLKCAPVFLFFITWNWKRFVLHKMRPLKWKKISDSTHKLSHFFAEHASRDMRITNIICIYICLFNSFWSSIAVQLKNFKTHIDAIISLIGSDDHINIIILFNLSHWNMVYCIL